MDMTAITPKVGDSVKELRESRDAETEDEFLARMKRRGRRMLSRSSDVKLQRQTSNSSNTLWSISSRFSISLIPNALFM